MTSCQRLVPVDLKPNHPAKWILPLHKKGYPFLTRCLLFLPPSQPSSFSSTLFSNKGRGDLGPAAILMRSRLAWRVITGWFSPPSTIWGAAAHCSSTYSSCWCTITHINLLGRSNCEIRTGGWGDDMWTGQSSNFNLYASINKSWQLQLQLQYSAIKHLSRGNATDCDTARVRIFRLMQFWETLHLRKLASRTSLQKYCQWNLHIVVWSRLVCHYQPYLLLLLMLIHLFIVIKVYIE